MAILAISYEFGSGAEEIGRAIEAQLGYEYIPLGRVLDEAKKAGGWRVSPTSSGTSSLHPLKKKRHRLFFPNGARHLPEF